MEATEIINEGALTTLGIFRATWGFVTKMDWKRKTATQVA